ncbi:helix-turn-helix domain-containing protein [Tsukamurella tyrosinosolvens]|uniref:helix-turn-helix domain-containing protein n=1 Tax=Tsukamurella tyrosinosolvens TaxID=57704 RepID=UPI0036BB99EE
MVSLSAAEAAAVLGVSQRQVTRLARAGELEIVGDVGGHLLLDSISVHRRARAGPRRGRPLTAAGAWAALMVLSGEGVEQVVDSPTLSRLRSRLRRSTAEEVAWMVRRRSVGTVRVQGWGDTAGLIPTGVSAISDVRWSVAFGLSVVPIDGFDGYVAEQDYAETARRLGLVEDREGRYSLRLVPVGARWKVDRVLVAAIAVDLMESTGTREAAAGRDVLTGLLAQDF